MFNETKYNKTLEAAVAAVEAARRAVYAAQRELGLDGDAHRTGRLESAADGLLSAVIDLRLAGAEASEEEAAEEAREDEAKSRLMGAL